MDEGSQKHVVVSKQRIIMMGRVAGIQHENFIVVHVRDNLTYREGCSGCNALICIDHGIDVENAHLYRHWHQVV